MEKDSLHTLEQIKNLVNNPLNLLSDNSDEPTNTKLKKDTEKPVNNKKQIPLSKKVKDFSDEKLSKRIFKATGKAIKEFNLIEEGDKILIALSGGKDSWVMLQILADLKKRAPVSFDLVAINIDQGYTGFRQDIIEDFLAEHQIPNHMEYFDIASILEEKISKDTAPCSLCARLRRGSLIGLAKKYNCNKIALGHHLDDFIETLLLNSFFIGKLASMSPKLKLNGENSGENTSVIRPLMYVHESEIREFASRQGFPIVCCECPLMCGDASDTDSKRRWVKQLLGILEEKIPNIRTSLMKSMSNVRLSHLTDTEIWDFEKENFR